MPINLTPLALLFTIAAIGISETAYLIQKRIAAEQPVCPIGEGCETVLNSKYNRLFLGIHNEVFGFLFYVAFAVIASLLVIGVKEAAFFLIPVAWAMLVGATAASAFFTYLQWRVIRAWCFWCVMSAITVVLMDLVMVWLMYF